MPHLSLVALVVKEYDPAIDFFVRILGFDLVEDVPALTNDGRPKRWVVVRPPGAASGILIARADGYERMLAAGVTLTKPPRTEPYGRVAVFRDIAGNKWDLLGPAPKA